jgi:DNA-directed RNA polymerase subunit M/transcription elongation factor TFIIS
MSEHVLESRSREAQQTERPSRHHRNPADPLIFKEINPLSVVDLLDGIDQPLHLTTFGELRELCPKCGKSHLMLVLRQTRVRSEHLFCTSCESCFDAHYAGGAPALTI